MSKSEEKKRNWEAFTEVIRQNMAGLEKIFNPDSPTDGRWDFPLIGIVKKSSPAGIQFNKNRGLCISFNKSGRNYEFQTKILDKIRQTTSKNADFVIEPILPDKFNQNVYGKFKIKRINKEECPKWYIDKALQIGECLNIIRQELEKEQFEPRWQMDDKVHNSSSQIGKKKGTTQNGKSLGNDKPVSNKTETHQKISALDPKQWGGVYFECDDGENVIKKFAVKDFLKELNEIGEYEVAYRPNFPDKGPEYFLDMEDADYVPGKCHPRLDKDLPKDKRITLKQLVSWPMKTRNEKDWEDYDIHNGYPIPHATIFPEYKMQVKDKKQNFVFPNGNNTAGHCVRPQIVLLGKNCSTSGDAGDLSAIWSNGFCDQADCLLDSVLAGGFFTDFIKCFKATDFGNEEEKYIRTDKPIFGAEDTWCDVYINILIQELWIVNKKFKIDPKASHYLQTS